MNPQEIENYSLEGCEKLRAALVSRIKQIEESADNFKLFKLRVVYETVVAANNEREVEDQSYDIIESIVKDDLDDMSEINVTPINGKDDLPKLWHGVGLCNPFGNTNGLKTIYDFPPFKR